MTSDPGDGGVLGVMPHQANMPAGLASNGEHGTPGSAEAMKTWVEVTSFLLPGRCI